MKKTGITRRVDELGRIVIPKEIRKSFHIKSGDLLEIFLNADDSIKLKKYSIIDKNQSFINSFLKELAKKIKADIFLTSLDELVFSSNSKYELSKLNSFFYESIKDLTEDDVIRSLILTDKIKIEGNILVHKLRLNGDIVGFIIINYFEDDTSNFSDLINFSFKFLQNYLEEE